MKKTHNKEFFYKYVTADVAKDILTSLRVKCSSPLLFNDPFDSQIEIKHDASSSEEIIRRTTGTICRLMKPLLKDGSIEEAHKAVLNEILPDTEFVKEHDISVTRFYQVINQIVMGFAKADRVFCVSEEKDNLLMWAQYADEHRGAVIKLKCVPEKDTALCVAKPVIYSDRIPQLKIEDLLNSEQQISEYVLNEILLTKSLDWAYEREWRVILTENDPTKDFDLRVIFEEELEAIYLGCRMSHNNKQEIMSIVRTYRKATSIYESLKDNNNFKLLFKELGDK